MVTPNLCCIPKAPRCRLDIRVATSVLLPLAHDENWTSGGAAKIRAIGGVIIACKTREILYIGGLGVPAQVVGAPLRASRKSWRSGPHSFWTSCGIYLKGAEANREISLRIRVFRQFPEVHPVRDCRCRIPA